MAVLYNTLSRFSFSVKIQAANEFRRFNTYRRNLAARRPIVIIKIIV